MAALKLADPIIDDAGLVPITGESSSSITSRPTAGVICICFELFNGGSAKFGFSRPHGPHRTVRTVL